MKNRVEEGTTKFFRVPRISNRRRKSGRKKAIYPTSENKSKIWIRSNTKAKTNSQNKDAKAPEDGSSNISDPNTKAKVKTDSGNAVPSIAIHNAEIGAETKGKEKVDSGEGTSDSKSAPVSGTAAKSAATSRAVVVKDPKGPSAKTGVKSAGPAKEDADIAGSSGESIKRDEERVKTSDQKDTKARNTDQQTQSSSDTKTSSDVKPAVSGNVSNTNKKKKRENVEFINQNLSKLQNQYLVKVKMMCCL